MPIDKARELYFPNYSRAPSGLQRTWRLRSTRAN